MRHAHRGSVLLFGVFLFLSSTGFAFENPYSKYFTTQDIVEIDRDIQRQMIKGQVVMIDTRDTAACVRVQRQLLANRNLHAAGSDISDICRQDSKYPITSVVIMRETSEQEFKKELNLGKLTSTEKNLFTATRNLGVAGLGTAGIMYLLPEKISGWKKKNLAHEWRDNANSTQWDDNNTANDIGQPIAGAAYYQIARHLDYSPMASFGYSVFMSTFFWEYGLESFSNKPSVQDLILTPVIGSLLGEFFYRLENTIKENKGKVLGSESLGKFCMILLNPAGAISDQINRMFKTKVIKDAKSRLVMRPYDVGPGASNLDRQRMMIGLEIEFFL
jgi:hypothetical protein